MTAIDLEAPQAVEFADGATERDARLLVAGAYPAKGLTVTEGDLDALVANFSGPVPVKVEHVDTPLDPLGLVERVWRDGAALMGRVQFPADMASFLARRGAHKLSVGLLPGPEWKLLEASLTLRPHVAGATLLSEGPRPPGGPHPPTPSPNSGGGGDGGEFSERAELMELRAGRLDAEVLALKAAGRLAPAAEGAARALLGSPGVVTLSDGSPEPAAETFRRFLRAQPPVVTLGETARARVSLNGGASGAAASTAGEDLAGDAEFAAQFSAADREVLRRLGVDPADVARTLRGEEALTLPSPKNGRGF